MRRTDVVIAALIASTLPSAALAASNKTAFSIPPSSLDAALAVFSEQSGIDVGVGGKKLRIGVHVSLRTKWGG